MASRRKPLPRYPHLETLLLSLPADAAEQARKLEGEDRVRFIEILADAAAQDRKEYEDRRKGKSQ